MIKSNPAGLTATHPFPGEYRVDFGVPTSGKLVLASISERDNFTGAQTIQAAPCGLPADATSDTYVNCAAPASANLVSIVIRAGMTNAVSDSSSFYVALIE